MKSGFEWKLKNLLEERYGNDKKFMKIIAAIDDRTHIKNGRFHKSERERMLMLLHILAIYSSEQETLSKFCIKSKMEDKGIYSKGFQFTNAIEGLKKLGFDIQRVDATYYLGEREYKDSILKDLMDCVSTRYYILNDKSELLITEAMVQRLRFDNRITRCELISLHFNYYISLLNETKDMYTFPEVFEDYEATINPILVEARYQPLSEKNIFDMYVVTELYFYLIENMGYLSYFPLSFQ